METVVAVSTGRIGWRAIVVSFYAPTSPQDAATDAGVSIAPTALR